MIGYWLIFLLGTLIGMWAFALADDHYELQPVFGAFALLAYGGTLVYLLGLGIYHAVK